MNIDTISKIFDSHIHQIPQHIKRCAVGIGNQVYIVECGNVNIIHRLNHIYEELWEEFSYGAL